MKKRHILSSIILILLIATIITGCSGEKQNKPAIGKEEIKESSGELIEKGINSLEIQDYDDAMSFFDMAIEDDPNVTTKLAKKMAEKYIELKLEVESIIVEY